MAVNKVCEVLRRLHLVSRCRCSVIGIRNYAVDHSKKYEPIKFSDSLASKLKVYKVMEEEDRRFMRVQKFVIISTVCIILYYCFTREYNKLDEILNGTFNYEEDDEIKLVNAIIRGKFKKMDTTEYEKKLIELKVRKGKKPELF